MNEKLIFQTLREATSKEASDTMNRPYFISEALLIFDFLLTTMQKAQLLENENEYLSFIVPFIDR